MDWRIYFKPAITFLGGADILGQSAEILATNCKAVRPPDKEIPGPKGPVIMPHLDPFHLWDAPKDPNGLL